MIITKLLQKYRTGSGRGMSAVSEPNLHFILNSVIDWTQSEFEEYPEGVTPPEGYKKDPFLEPGDCFCFGVSKRDDSNARVVLAMDKGDQVVCIINDTGVLALQRILDEKIKPEFSLLKTDYSKVDVREWGPKVTATDLNASDLLEIPIDKNKYRLMKDRLLSGRGISMPEAFIEATVVSDDTLGFEVPLVLTKYSVYTRTTDNMFVDIPGFMEDLVDQVLGWFYNEVPVIKDGKVIEKEE